VNQNAGTPDYNSGGEYLPPTGPFNHIHEIVLGTTKLAPTNHHLTKKYCDLIWDALNAFGDNR
jgi:hypothetical protein